MIAREGAEKGEEMRNSMAVRESAQGGTCVWGPGSDL